MRTTEDDEPESAKFEEPDGATVEPLKKSAAKG